MFSKWVYELLRSRGFVKGSGIQKVQRLFVDFVGQSTKILGVVECSRYCRGGFRDC